MPCHGGGGKRGPAAGFDASSYEGVMKGGRDGSMVTASDPDKSQLVDYLKGTKKPQMPMKRPPLSDADMKVITDWIKAGAKNS
jgi:hypothetical protein